jgi:protein-S-isoprenylcysteine O-methyltransferase Ste14
MFMFGIHLIVRFLEEPATERRLGDDYNKYKKHVPRWLPKKRQ